MSSKSFERVAGFTQTLAKTDFVVRTQRVQNRLHGH